LEVDESYELNVTDTGVSIHSKTRFGTFWAIETLYQLITWDTSRNLFIISKTPIYIIDAPRFTWRGLLVDTARHYIPLEVLFKIMDGMAMNKMNVLHMHLVDAEAFSILTPTQPSLAKKGAWNDNAIYDKQAITSIIKYGLERGIRVVPEIDTPGHSYSWGNAYPNIVVMCPNTIYTRTGYPLINDVPLDMTNNQTYDIVRDVIADVSNTFSDKCIHLGGDELSPKCLDENPRIKQWMADHHMKTDNYTELVIFYETQLIEMMKKHNKTTIFWEEIFVMFHGRSDNPLPKGKDTIVHVWGPGTGGDRATIMQNALDAGHGVLLSDGWYLDKVRGLTPDIYLYADTWKFFYLNEPTTGLNISKEHFFLGGEICQWGEEADQNNIEILIFPRVAAAAERLWSQKNVNDYDFFFARLRYQRCRMTQRGIKALPIRPDYCPYIDDHQAVFPSWIIAAEVVVFSIVTVIMITISIVLCRMQSKYAPLSIQ